MMRLPKTVCIVWAVLTPVASAWAAPVVVVSQGEEANLLATYSSLDLIQGLIPAELSGDNGWHPANTDPLDRLPAFTDGTGIRATGLTGLLNDFPTLGQPTKMVRYDLAQKVDVQEIRVFTGNNGRDGRVFHTYTVAFSGDGGQTYSPEIYVQSHPSGSLNNAANNQWRVVLSQLTDDTGRLAGGVNAIRLHFYSVDNTGGQMRDPFDGVNPYTNVDDLLSAAFVSPLVWEIDIFGVPSEICNNGLDDDGDLATDCTDSDCTGTELCLCNDPFADADDDGDVDQLDFGTWQLCFTGITGPLPASPTYCSCFDRDNSGAGDGDVDAQDFNAFQVCASGPTILADLACDGQ